ncbi:hypothetical protein OC845_004597 [Tilletia horrida]|nr:hypothetical protein OC845_004597 [Tilletia horrida]
MIFKAAVAVWMTSVFILAASVYCAALPLERPFSVERQPPTSAFSLRANDEIVPDRAALHQSFVEHQRAWAGYMERILKIIEHGPKPLGPRLRAKAQQLLQQAQDTHSAMVDIKDQIFAIAPPSINLPSVDEIPRIPE